MKLRETRSILSITAHGARCNDLRHNVNASSNKSAFMPLYLIRRGRRTTSGRADSFLDSSIRARRRRRPRELCGGDFARSSRAEEYWSTLRNNPRAGLTPWINPRINDIRDSVLKSLRITSLRFPGKYLRNLVESWSSSDPFSHLVNGGASDEAPGLGAFTPRARREIDKCIRPGETNTSSAIPTVQLSLGGNRPRNHCRSIPRLEILTYDRAFIFLRRPIE